MGFWSLVWCISLINLINIELLYDNWVANFNNKKVKTLTSWINYPASPHTIMLQLTPKISKLSWTGNSNSLSHYIPHSPSIRSFTTKPLDSTLSSYKNRKKYFSSYPDWKSLERSVVTQGKTRYWRNHPQTPVSQSQQPLSQQLKWLRKKKKIEENSRRDRTALHLYLW